MTTHLPMNNYGCTFIVLMKTLIYMGSLIMKDKEKKNDF